MIRDVNSTHQGDHVNNNTTDLPSKQDIEEAEAMLQKLKNSTPQQLGLEEEEAMMRMRQRKSLCAEKYYKVGNCIRSTRL